MGAQSWNQAGDIRGKSAQYVDDGVDTSHQDRLAAYPASLCQEHSEYQWTALVK
jgi:hypothetical protein